MHRMRGRLLLANDMGTGKSLTSLLYANRHPHLRPIVIVCPASLKYNWQSECRKHFNWPSQVLEGTKTEELPACGITIINYDILVPWLDYLYSLNPQLVILDETHYIANRGTKRTRASRMLCEGVPHVIGLSGTPLTNRPVELWPILNILFPEEFPNFFPFAMRYGAPKRVPWASGWSFTGASHTGELHQKLIGKMIRRRKEDVLKELPSKQRIVVPLEILDRPQYTHAEREFLDWLKTYDPTRVSSAQRAERLTRLGYLKRLAANLKLHAVCDWVNSFLSESDGKLLLFAVHKSILAELWARYGKISVLVDGSVSSKGRQLAVNQFQTHAKTRIFIGQMKAAGVGLNLTAASTVAFAELDWVPGNHVQCEDRIHRIGQKEHSTIYYLVARETLEERLLEVIQHKQETINQILEGTNGTADTLDVYSQLCDRLQKEQGQ